MRRCAVILSEAKDLFIPGAMIRAMVFHATHLRRERRPWYNRTNEFDEVIP